MSSSSSSSGECSAGASDSWNSWSRLFLGLELLEELLDTSGEQLLEELLDTSREQLLVGEHFARGRRGGVLCGARVEAGGGWEGT